MLLNLHSGKTNHRLGRLPLVLGMPVIIGSNYDVQAGVVNGTSGILRKIRYRLDSDNQRHLVSCVVECSNLKDFDYLPQLTPNHVAVMEDTVSM
ncbi:hypothetical protein EV361DRAFT_801842, partial [Lentinula raphanica]